MRRQGARQAQEREVGEEGIRTYTIRVDLSSEEPITSYVDDGSEPLKVVDYQMVANPEPGFFVGVFIPLAKHIQDEIYRQQARKVCLVSGSPTQEV